MPLNLLTYQFKIHDCYNRPIFETIIAALQQVSINYVLCFVNIVNDPFEIVGAIEWVLWKFYLSQEQFSISTIFFTTQKYLFKC